MRFLIADDSATMRRVIINCLQRIGFDDCIEAADGAEALDRFDASVGFVITDWDMPNMSGVDFARALRARPDGNCVPILMVTARGVREDVTAAIEAGVDSYVLKPFSPQVLRQKIDQLLATAGART